MKVAFVHPHVLEDLVRIGIKPEKYRFHAGYEHRYARLLRSHGWSADLYVFSRSVREIRVCTHVWGHNVFIVPLSGPKFLRYVPTLSTMVKLFGDYDVVHCFSYYSNIFDVLAPACIVANVPLVAQSQGIYPNMPFQVYLRKVVSLRFASKLLPLSRFEAEFLRKKFRIRDDKISIVPNFIETAEYQRLEKTDARRTLGIDLNSFVVLTVCRLVPEKGVQTLLKATAALREKIPSLIVIVVGEGPFRPYLENLAIKYGIKDIVRFDGYVPNQQIGKYYSAADCFVLASFEESFGIVLLEALWYGLPTIASKTWGAAEILSGNSIGVFFPPGNSEKLAEKLLEVFSVYGENLKICFNKRDKVLSRFSPENVFKLLIKIYNEVLK